MISGRQAEAVLHERIGLTRRHARRVLAAGLAGAPVRVGHFLAFVPERVDALATRAVVTEAEMDEWCPDLLVLRRDVDITHPSPAVVTTLQDGWDFSPWTRVALHVRIERARERGCGGMPVVATTAGFVTCGAELVCVRPTRDVGPAGRIVSRLELVEPGAWFDHVRDRRYKTGPGRPWWIRGWPPAEPARWAGPAA